MALTINTDSFHNAYPLMLERALNTPDHAVSPRRQQTHEIQDVTLVLSADSDDGAVQGRTDMRYLLAEMAWYLSRNPAVGFIGKYAKLWKGIANPDGTANSNYGALLWNMGADSRFEPRLGHDDSTTEWGWAKASLLRDVDTRQAAAVFHRPQHHWEGNKDVPCTLTTSWAVRDGALQQRVHMRSSDAWFGLPYDVPFFRWMHRRMRWELEAGGMPLRMGQSRLLLDSFHLYGHRFDDAHAFTEAEWQPAASWVNPVGHEGPLEERALEAFQLLAALETRRLNAKGASA